MLIEGSCLSVTTVASIVPVLELITTSSGTVGCRSSRNPSFRTSTAATADKVKAEMVQLKSENEALLAQAREERAAILREAKDASDKMIAEAKEKAKTEYDHIITDARDAIEQQKNAAIVDVKNMIGKMVIEVTEKVIRRELVNKDDHEEYILKLADDLTNADSRGGN